MPIFSRAPVVKIYAYRPPASGSRTLGAPGHGSVWALQTVLLWAAFALPMLTCEAKTLEFVLMPGEVIAEHAEVESECAKCHIVFERERQPELCVACHEDIGNDLAAGTGFHGKSAASRCRTCHTEHRGRKADIVTFSEHGFAHDRTDFQLTGAHRRAKCHSCHKPGKKYRAAPHRCAECHAHDDVHRKHFGSHCHDCHDTDLWTQATFDHGTTDFQLTGSHSDVACTACHNKHEYGTTPKTCFACHSDDDDHRGQFGRKCETCHTEVAWQKTTFDHDQGTKYPLRGAHRLVKACGACHTQPLFRNSEPRECVACHLDNDAHNRHFGNECSSCHVPNQWSSATFDHNRDTRFKIERAHARAVCDMCHQIVVDPTEPVRTCEACHVDDDVHKNVLGSQCNTCHQQSLWHDTRFDHNQHTKFTLTHKHADVSCISCHGDLTFRRATPSACVDCHKRDDTRRGHRGRFGSRCDSCHSTKSWTLARFDHRRASGYPLKGKHRRVTCTQCHTDFLYKQKLDRTCVSCHREDDPHEASVGLHCQTCHSELAWNRSMFNHDRSSFKLLGAHISATCQSCHQSAQYNDTPSACVACHANDDAHHERLGPRCEQCHGASSWRKAHFDHATDTQWPLANAHATVKCTRCHIVPMRGKMQISTACFSCHRNDDLHMGSLSKRCGHCHQSTHWRDVTGQARAWAQQGGPPPNEPIPTSR
jgi:hypothetical protein